MKTNELRLGNYVKIADDVYQVRGIETSTIWMSILGIASYYEYSDSEVEPIPITEEWLKKFGFKIADVSFGGFLSPKIGNRRMRILINHRGYFYAIDEFTELPILYVHQLQNLFYCLMNNEELTLKQ